jgi:hypothetical protein
MAQVSEDRCGDPLKGQGHVVVYELTGQILYVIDYFHTSEDWRNKF